MTFAQLERTPEWRALSPQQRFWLQSYLATNDREFATRAAYDGSPANARTMAYYVLKNRKVQAVLNRYLNKGAREIFLEQLQADLKKSKPGSVACAKLQALIAEFAFEVKV